MLLLASIFSQLQTAMTAWRQDFHRHPEFGFEERRTAQIVADRLRSFGIDVEEGVGGTGVVGTLSGTANRSIAPRADMDALHIQEATNAVELKTLAICMPVGTTAIRPCF